MKTHAEMVEEQHAEIDQELTRTDDAEAYGEDGTGSKDPIKNARTDEESAENLLLDELVSAGCNLESQARRIMMNQLPEGAAPQTVLRADRNQQLRDMRSLGVDEKRMKQIMSEDGGGDSDLLQQVCSHLESFPTALCSDIDFW